MPEVEIFKTNISCPQAARQLVLDLEALFPGKQINFDLEDCDRILRVEGNEIFTDQVITELQQRGHYCELLQ